VTLKILNNPWKSMVYLLVSACAKYAVLLRGLCLPVEVNFLCIFLHNRDRTVIQSELNLKKKMMTRLSYYVNAFIASLIS